MNIMEMLTVWADQSTGVAANAQSMIKESRSVVAQSASNMSWGIDLDEWEEELNCKIKETLDVLIYGKGRDKGILTTSECVAVEYHHIASVYRSNRTDMVDDYTTALFKLKPAMERRGFIVE